MKRITMDNSVVSILSINFNLSGFLSISVLLPDGIYSAYRKWDLK